jgi:RNA polymerase sigma-70 factor (ECF subfamily)
MAAASGDSDLYARFRAGDREAMAVLFRRHRDDVFALCCRLAGTDAAADLVQETFLRVWRYRRGFAGRARFSTWLYTVARNVCLDHLRADGRRRALRETEANRFSPHEASFARYERDERALTVRAAVAALPDRTREALVLIRFHGLSYREAAEICDTSEGAMKQRVLRAMRQLRDALRNEENSSAL